VDPSTRSPDRRDAARDAGEVSRLGRGLRHVAPSATFAAPFAARVTA
jgi:hypothetical protein